MTDDFPNEGRSAQRVGEDGDRWRCSLCSGYVRGNAPMCKHCHAQFGASEPSPLEATAGASEPSKPPTLREKVAMGFMLAFAIVICVGCYMLATRIGGAAGIVTGWMLAPFLLVVTCTLIAFSFGDTFEKGVRESTASVAILWLFLTLLVLPIMVFVLVIFYVPAWWGRPLGISIMLTMYSLLVIGITRTPMFKNDPPADKQTLTVGNIMRDWRKSMLTVVVPYTVLIFIGERLGFEFIYAIGLILLFDTRLRTWLWTQCKTLWQRISSRT